MMASMGAVSDSSVVVTIVHDCQVSFLAYILSSYVSLNLIIVFIA